LPRNIYAGYRLFWLEKTSNLAKTPPSLPIQFRRNRSWLRVARYSADFVISFILLNMTQSAVLTWVFGLLLVFWALGAYNRLTRLRGEITSTYALMAEQLHQRDGVAARLAAQLAVHGVDAQAQEAEQAAREQARLAREAARLRLYDAPAVAALGSAQQVHASSLRRLTSLVETQPALYADELFHQLCDELGAAEGAGSLARTQYNRAVQAYNQAIGQFPAFLLAKLFGFALAASLDLPDSASVRRTAPAPLQ
jgi:LemA protein